MPIKITEVSLASGDVTPDDNPHFYIEVGGVFRRLTLAQLIDCINDDLNVGGLSNAAKTALLNCFEHVAWVDDDGQTYYDALYDALYPTPTSITAVFTQGGHTIYDTQPLDDLRQYLVVNAVFEDGTEHTVADYTLSGTLTPGTSVITVTYDRCTTTFNVDVTENFGYITAEYTQSGTVYDSDTLDDLKDDLVVTYFESQQVQQGVVLNDEDYTLSGTLEAGTSTITATYLGLTDTFSVTVAADPSYIAAVFTQPQTPIYTDDPLDDLKADLVVTYHDRQGQSTVLSANQYTLSGTLVAGTNTVTVTYGVYTTTFSVTGVVDFYNIWSWSSTDDTVTVLDTVCMPSNDNIILADEWTSPYRRAMVTPKGKGTGTQYLYNNSRHPTGYYPIPVPPTATGFTITLSEPTQKIVGYLVKYTGYGSAFTTENTDDATWHTGQHVSTGFTASEDLYLCVCVNRQTTDPETTITLTFS